MSEETPVTRLRILLELMKKLPDDLEILIELAEEDEEVREQLSQIAVELLNLQSMIITRMAVIASRRLIGYGTHTGAN